MAFSVAEATRSRSPGVSSVTFRAQSPDLRFASLMDMDFAVSGPLVRRSRLVPGSCPSTRTFALRFLQTAPRGDSPCVVTNPSPPSGWVEDFHLQVTEHAQHTTMARSRARISAPASPPTCSRSGRPTSPSTGFRSSPQARPSRSLINTAPSRASSSHRARNWPTPICARAIVRTMHS